MDVKVINEPRIVCGDNLALTPHMGWNSWHALENHITDQHGVVMVRMI